MKKFGAGFGSGLPVGRSFSRRPAGAAFRRAVPKSSSRKSPIRTELTWAGMPPKRNFPVTLRSAADSSRDTLFRAESHGGRRCPHLRLRLLLGWRSQHIVPAESTTYAFSPAAASYTVDRGANPLWARSENGFVPHFAWGSPNAIVRRRSPFPGSPICPATQPPGHPFWLRSVILARRPVSARDCPQVTRSPTQKCRFP